MNVRRALRRRFVSAAGIAVLAGAGLVVPSVLAAGPALADASTGSGGQFIPVQDRILDTRSSVAIGGYSTPMPANTWRTVQVTGQAGIPTSGVAAVAVNFTVLNDSTDGYLKADKNESTPNGTVSYLHWQGGVAQSNSGVVAVGDGGKIQVEATSTTDLLIDVQGYYTGGDPTAGGFVPVTQTRLVDTRNGTGLPQAQLSSGTTVTIPVVGLADVPSDASAVMLDFVVLNQTASGWITPYPADQSRPQQSLNFGTGANDATTMAVGLSSTGTPLGAIDLYAHPASGTIDLVVDVLGYFTATESGGAFTPGAARVYDSRWPANTSLAGGATRTIPIAGQAEVPATGISAAAINIAVFNDAGAADGFLRAWPSGATESIADLAVQYPAGGSTSNMMTMALGSDGAITVHNMTSADTIDIAIFVEGWYLSPPSAPRNVHESDIGADDTVTVTWDAPASSGNYPIDGYAIYDFTGRSFHVDANSRSVIVPSVPDEYHGYGVFAHSAAGWSQPGLSEGAQEAPTQDVTVEEGTTDPSTGAETTLSTTTSTLANNSGDIYVAIDPSESAPFYTSQSNLTTDSSTDSDSTYLASNEPGCANWHFGGLYLFCGSTPHHNVCWWVNIWSRRHNSLGVTMFTWHYRINWCVDDANRITSISHNSWATDIDSWWSYEGQQAIGWWYTWGGKSHGGHYSARIGRFKQQLFFYTASAAARIDYWIHGDTTWRAIGNNHA